MHERQDSGQKFLKIVLTLNKQSFNIHINQKLNSSYQE